jgi:hypothetical protein
MARRRRRRVKRSRKRSSGISLPFIGRVPTNPLLGAAGAIIGEPILDMGWNMISGMLPIPTNVAGVQVDDFAKFMFAPKIGRAIGGDFGAAAGSTLRVISAVRMVDGVLGGALGGITGGGASTGGGDDW